jgi:hypothetical protein
MRAEFFDTTADGLVVGLQLRGPSQSGALLKNVADRPGNAVQSMSNTGQQSCVFRVSQQMHQAMGQDLSFYRANCSAQMGASPSGTTPADFACYIQIFAGSNTSTATTVQYNILVEQDVELFDVLL